MELRTRRGPSLTEERCALPFLLYQVYLSAGLASLLQVRVTELPSSISAEGLTDTEGGFGASGRDVFKVINIKG